MILSFSLYKSSKCTCIYTLHKMSSRVLLSLVFIPVADVPFINARSIAQQGAYSVTHA